MPSPFPGMNPYLENPQLWEVYNQARFDMAIDYTLEPVPPLKSEDKLWADELLKEKGLR